MNQRNRLYFSIISSFLLYIWASIAVNAQQEGPYFKFPVLQDGVYRLPSSQASALGYQSLEQVGIFGIPGMLPQKLDSSALDLQAIPVRIIGENLYFFLHGPHQVFNAEEGFDFQVHHYSDTLFYLIGPAVSQSATITSTQIPASGPDLQEIFGVQYIKWEETNLLTSGRSWFSRPIFNRERLSYNFTVLSGASGPPKLTAKVMGQSFSEGRMEFFHNNTQVGDVSINSIPNTTFGIKGREAVFSANLQNAPNYNIQVNFISADLNGTGYLSYSLLAFPFSPSNAPSGVYFSR